MIKRDYLKNAVELICLMYNLNDIPYDKNILEELDKLANSIESNKIDGLTIAKKGLEQDFTDTVGKTADEFKSDAICLEFIENFCKSHGIKKSPLSLCLQLYKESNEEKKRLLQGLKKAHGVS